MSERTGVLVLSYGTPRTRDEIEGYYTRIRRGRPPSREQLADLVRRYDAIGGLSPLNERTADQVAGIARKLELDSPGRFVVAGATKYAEPSIEEGVERLLDAGVSDIVGIALAPLSATMSTGQYHDRARAAIEGRVAYREVWSWWQEPLFVPLLAARVRRAIAETPTATTVVLFTAHALPARVVAEGDDYADQLGAAAAEIAKVAGLDHCLVCWQSAGRTQEQWLGPDILEVIRSLDPAATTDVVVCPVGFVSDHLEVLYDVDVEAVAVGAERGIQVHRTESLNADPAFLSILARRIERMEPYGW